MSGCHIYNTGTPTLISRLQLDGVARRTPELGCSGVNSSNFLRHGIARRRCRCGKKVGHAAHHLQGALSCRGYVYGSVWHPSMFEVFCEYFGFSKTEVLYQIL
jgi:hypothetical protein